MIRQGFTLVELLVVVAMIAVLVALSVFGIFKFRNRAKEVVAVTNLRQVAPLFHAYAVENYGAFPYGGYGNIGWDRTMVTEGFIKEEALQTLLLSPFHKHDIKLDKQQRSYSMIRAKGKGVAASVYPPPDPDQPPPDTRIRVSKIQRDASTILLAERFAGSNRFGGYAFSVMDFPQEALNVNPDRKKCNFLFVDGHVETLPHINTVGKGTLTAPGGGWTIDPSD